MKTFLRFFAREREQSSDLRDGALGQFAFLRVDVVGHSKLTRENPSSLVAEVLDGFESLIDKLSADRRARIWSWAGDGGLIAFQAGSTTAKVGDAVAVAFELLASLPEFNVRHPLPEGKVDVRTAVHTGPAVYRVNTGRIHSSPINLVSHLEHQRTHANSISITHDVYRELPVKERERFVSAGAFEGTAIYTSDLDRRGRFPKKGDEWTSFVANVAVLAEKLEPYKEHAIFVGFYRTSAVLAGMLAPNLGIKPVVNLGRDDRDGPVNRYASLSADLASQGHRVIVPVLALESAEELAVNLDYLTSRGSSLVVIAALYASSNAVKRLEKRGITVLCAETREMSDRVYDELPWVLEDHYDHW
jgi:class 3 adenylate cyclase